MNITFLLIIIAAAAVIYIIQNLLKIKIKSAGGFLWIINVILLLIMAEALIVKLEAIDEFPHVFLVTFPLRFLVPFVVARFWRKTLLLRYNPLHTKIRFVWLTWLVYLILLPILSLDAAEKLIYLNDPPLIIRLLFVAHLVFTIFILSKLIRYSRTHTDVTSPLKRLPLIGMAAYVIAYALAIIEIRSIWQADILSSSLLLISLWIFWFASLQERKGLSNKALKNLRHKVEKERLFTDPELSLNSLAEALKTSPNEVSKLINTHLSVNFNDYINECRVIESIQLLKDKENNKYTLETIAKMAGFNSTTTFNKAFKKVTGKTPKAYKD